MSTEKTVATPITRRALVIGGGISGIQAALDIADGGYEVVLVESSPSIGGHMIQLSEVFPTLDCPQCIMTPKMVEIAQHLRVRLLSYSEVQDVSGSAGNFKVKIRRKARYVNEDRCTGCGICQAKCPWTADSEFDRGLIKRKAIYIPFAQAVPNVPVIDRDVCVHFQNGKCGACAMFCEAKAIDFEQTDRIEEIEVGAIIVAIGYETMPRERTSEYAEGPDVIDGLQFERILCPSGHTAGVPRKPSDGTIPKEVVFISCVGSRDPEHGVPYCSRVCCMYLAKMALIYKHAAPDGQAYVFYMDTRTTGKGYEEFVERAVKDEGLLYLRGKVARVYREGDKLKVQGVDTLTGKRVDISCDLVVLGMAMVPNPGAKELARRLGILTDEYGFITEADPKLRPLETTVSGIFVCGTAQGPRDIPDSVAQASGAAGKVLALFSQSELQLEGVKVG